MKILRVFPRKTNATPDDENVRFDMPGLFDEADEIHLSVTFTWDVPKAEQMAKEWKYVAPVKLGGPAYNEPGGDFTPGLYLKKGYVITSRGCPNRCWFCNVPKREGGTIRELPVTEGKNLLDDNILACSDNHIKTVFAMLEKQSMVEFTGGLEAARLKDWHIDALLKVRPRRMFFAYDTPDDLDPLVAAGKKLKEAGFNSQLRAYILMGHKNDTLDKAEKRMRESNDAGFLPFPMLWRDENKEPDKAWKKFQHLYARPAISRKLLKND